MRRFTFHILISLLTLTFIACEDVVEVDIDKASPQLSIDAIITNSAEPQIVRLTKSVDYFDNSGIFPPVSADSVVMTDNSGKKFYFDYQQAGEYVYNPSSTDTFKIGENYTLNIYKGSDIYTAQSNMYRSTSIDSIVGTFYENVNQGQGGYFITMYARDLKGVGDYYWIRTFRNGEFMNAPGKINTSYDGGFEQMFSDSQLLAFPISFMQINDFSKPYKLGEKVKVEILGISEDMYNFLNVASSQMQNGGMFATPPVNVKTNFTKNRSQAMTPVGFFNICDLQSLEIEIEG